jgi:hypothetical protein
MEHATTSQLAAIGIAISFIGLGILARSQKRPWKAFLLGGVALLAVAVMSLVLGWPL